MEQNNIDWKRLGFHTVTFVGMGGMMMIVLEALPENATAWNKSEVSEIPSIQDLVITPVIGSMIGEGFHVCKKKIIAMDYMVCGKRWIGKTICWLIDPFNEFANIFLSKKDTLTSSIMVTRNSAILSVNVTF